ncbi:MAG TPA: catalase, partial [Burkholderiaceae bacterium]|nr:catalase [Burkholderiaceae bacterium]
TPVFVRFSTVAGSRGSADTVRDVRGFAVKFYTEEGNFDLVGNNIPVFFIQDAIKFPDLIHAVKMEPDRGFPQAGSAHDTFYDFISLTPEAFHMIMWAMSDRTIPRSLRMIEGFGIHSFRLLNDAGESTFVKFHWRPKLGLQSTLWDEAVKLAGADPDFQRRDLFEAISAGHFPEWEFAVQLFTQEEADAFPFDHLDATKLIPEELVPLKVVGRMVLDRWPDNFFAETEQVAYCPSHVVPGIDFSNDPLLQGRLFSYLDTQLSRLGSPNFHQIPVNAPKCPFANQQRDGQMQMGRPSGRVAYEPSSLAPDSARESPRLGFRSFAADEPGDKGRVRPESFADHYSQARLFFRSQSEPERAHIASALVFELSKVETTHIRAAIVGHLRHIDGALAQRVADGLGMAELPPAPPTAAPVVDHPPSPALTLIGKMKPTLEGRCVGILVNDGSDAKLVAALRDAAKAAGARVKIVAPKVGGATLADGSKLPADGQLAGTPSIVFDAVAVLLSEAGAAALANDAPALGFVRDAFGHLKAIAIDAGGQRLLQAAGIEPDAGVIAAHETKRFIDAAMTRQWAREPRVRALA